MLRRLSQNAQTSPGIFHGVLKVFVFLVMISGVLPLLLSITLWCKTVMFFTSSEVTTGRIERVDPRPGRSMSYVPIYSFTDRSHNQRQGEGVLSETDKWTVGQEVSIRYDPHHPAESKLNTFHDLWMVPLLVLGFSLVYVVMSVFTYRHLSK